MLTGQNPTKPPGSAPAIGRSTLRQATHEVHIRLHGLAAFTALLDGSLTRSGYRSLLSGLYGFHCPLELTLLDAAREHSLLVAVPRRIERLVDDLGQLGMSDGERAGLPLAPRLPLHTPGHLLGALYVREGSTLGGKVLARNLEHLLGPGTAGRSFLIGSPRDSEHWRACCAAIERGVAAGHLDDMVESARATFAAFEQWMSEAVDVPETER